MSCAWLVDRHILIFVCGKSTDLTHESDFTGVGEYCMRGNKVFVKL